MQGAEGPAAPSSWGPGWTPPPTRACGRAALAPDTAPSRGPAPAQHLLPSLAPCTPTQGPLPDLCPLSPQSPPSLEHHLVSSDTAHPPGVLPPPSSTQSTAHVNMPGPLSCAFRGSPALRMKILQFTWSCELPGPRGPASWTPPAVPPYSWPNSDPAAPATCRSPPSWSRPSRPSLPDTRLLHSLAQRAAPQLDAQSSHCAPGYGRCMIISFNTPSTPGNIIIPILQKRTLRFADVKLLAEVTRLGSGGAGIRAQVICVMLTLPAPPTPPRFGAPPAHSCVSPVQASARLSLHPLHWAWALSSPRPPWGTPASDPQTLHRARYMVDTWLETVPKEWGPQPC